jgi:hypothetical protein
MPLYDPTILKKRICPFVVSQVYALASVTDNITLAWMCIRFIADQALEIADIVRGNCKIQLKMELTANG